MWANVGSCGAPGDAGADGISAADHRARSRGGAPAARRIRMAGCQDRAMPMTPFRLPDGRSLDLYVSGPEDGVPFVMHHGTPGSYHPSSDLERAVHAPRAADGDLVAPRLRRLHPAPGPHRRRRRRRHPRGARGPRRRPLHRGRPLGRRPARAGLRGPAGAGRVRAGHRGHRAVRGGRPRLPRGHGPGQPRRVRRRGGGGGVPAPLARPAPRGARGRDPGRDRRRDGEPAARRGPRRADRPLRRGGGARASTRRSAPASTAGWTTTSRSRRPGASTSPRSACRCRSGRARST